MRRLLLAAVLASVGGVAHAQQPEPQPPPLPVPVDQPWPGTVSLSVDLTDLVRHVVQVRETIPVRGAGPLTLLYPRFIPGDHAPDGPIAQLAGLRIMGGGVELRWQRDVVHMEAFHLDVPDGVSSLELSFQYISAVGERQGRIDITPDMTVFDWNTSLLYPAGVFVRDVMVQPHLKLPDGWKFATALDGAQQGPDGIIFAPLPLEFLVDSPVLAGRNFRRIDLGAANGASTAMDVVGDQPTDLAATQAQIAVHQALVQQATRLFGPPHFAHYDILLALSDSIGAFATEHAQSSENSDDRSYFTGWEKRLADRDLLPHELAHSWNGKFRRPADLWAPDFSTPTRNSLLWVYEGLTQYWGQVLAARSGLWTKQQALDAIAFTAARMDAEPGRGWRPLQDTTNDPILTLGKRQSWPSWQRTDDYYSEGVLIWLDIDTLIRAQTAGRSTLDDFAHAFFGVDAHGAATVTYRFGDVVDALHGVLGLDWNNFLRYRLDHLSQWPPFDGLTRGGYRLVYDETKSDFFASMESQRGTHDLDWSIGVRIGSGGSITAVIWDSPAWRAGVVIGDTIVAVNDTTYGGAGDVEHAIATAKGTTAPIDLLLKQGIRLRAVHIDFHDGLRYPHLERVPTAPALLDDILAPLN